MIQKESPTESAVFTNGQLRVDFAAGCAYEERYVRFGMRDRACRKAARFVLGLCVIGMVYGLGKLLPDLLWLIPIRYFFVAFAGYGLVPMLFKKLGI